MLIVLIAIASASSGCAKDDQTASRAACNPDGTAPACPGVLSQFFNVQTGVGKASELSAAVSNVSWSKTRKTKRHSECDAPGPCADDQEAKSAFRGDAPDFRKLPSDGGVLVLATMSFLTSIPGHDVRYKAGSSKVKDGTTYLLLSSEAHAFGQLVPPQSDAGTLVGYWYLVRIEGADVKPVSYGEMHSCAGRDTSTTLDADFYGCSLHVASASQAAPPPRLSVALTSLGPSQDCESTAALMHRAPRAMGACRPTSPSLKEIVFAGAEFLGVRRATLDEIAAMFIRADTALDAYWFPCTYGCCTA